MVCSLLRDFHHSFAMILPFFWASLLTISLSFLGEWMRWRGDLAMIIGGIGFGKRKMKVAAANDNGER
jgi:hypothetical protein